MSKERELLNKAIEMIQIAPMMVSIGNVPPDFGSELILEIKELLTQPVKYQFTTRLDQESVMYQYRDKLDGKDWGRWNLCNKIDYEDYKNNPTFQHWTYQTRKLLAQPEQVQELLGTQVSFKDSSGKLITVDISFVRELVERYSEVSSEGSRHRKGYKDRSWGI